MKLSRKILGLTLLLLLLILSGCNKATKSIIPSPSKIIVYNNGLTKTLTATDKEYENIVKLTNSRVKEEKLAVAKDADIDNFVNMEKKNATAVEFIYDEETEIDVKNSNGFSPIKFNKLFFKLSEDESNSNTVFQYGNKDKYIDSSRGPLEESKELLEFVYAIFK